MTWDDIPRTHSFSLGDFHDFDFCVFRFFVNHHLQKKYELAEGNTNQAIGSLLDLSIKKLHQTKAYFQPIDYLVNLIKAAEVDIREDVKIRGTNSFYGALLPFLTPEIISQTKEIFKNYHQAISGKYKQQVATETLKKIRPFWKYVIRTDHQSVQLWGGPDAIEQGEDSIPEIIDYKYREKEKDQGKIDMDLMPKVYTLLCAKELQALGYKKARFKVKFWSDPKNETFYEEFDLAIIPNLEIFFKDKIERILNTQTLTFCEKDFCRVCKHSQREEWIKELQLHGWIIQPVKSSVETSSDASDLPF